jgi:hypothetical protein
MFPDEQDVSAKSISSSCTPETGIQCQEGKLLAIHEDLILAIPTEMTRSIPDKEPELKHLYNQEMFCVIMP